MLLYLSWSEKAVKGKRLARNMVLQYIHITSVNVEELTEEDEVQVDSEILKVRSSFESLYNTSN